jgi:LysR family transcriptional regulator, nitrogen assimilation regulatory protein
LDLRQLQYFLRAVQMSSISKAAAALRVAQPALSRQIRQLESELGVALLTRDGRGVAPTQTGRAFAEKIAAMLEQLEQSRADVIASRGVPTGDVTLGTTFAVGAHFIAALIKDFRARYASANLRVIEGFSYHVVEWLQTGRVDMGIIYHPGYYPRLQHRPLLQQSLCLIGRRVSGNRSPKTIAFKKAVQRPLIMPVRPNSISDLVETAAKSEQVTVNLKLEVDSISTIKQLVKEGEGFTILQHTSVHDDVERGELFAARIENPRITKPFVLCFPPRGTMTLAAKMLIALIDEEVATFIKQGRWVNG